MSRSSAWLFCLNHNRFMKLILVNTTFQISPHVSIIFLFQIQKLIIAKGVGLYPGSARHDEWFKITKWNILSYSPKSDSESTIKSTTASVVQPPESILQFTAIENRAKYSLPLLCKFHHAPLSEQFVDGTEKREASTVWKKPYSRKLKEDKRIVRRSITYLSIPVWESRECLQVMGENQEVTTK